jgi:hypothetical protein
LQQLDPISGKWKEANSKDVAPLAPLRPANFGRAASQPAAPAAAASAPAAESLVAENDGDDDWLR